MPVDIQKKGDGSRERREANHISTERTREDARKTYTVLHNERIAPCPPTLDKHGEQARDATEGDSAQHHEMRWDERAIASNIRVSLNIPAGAFKKNDCSKQSSQSQDQAQCRDGSQ